MSVCPPPTHNREPYDTLLYCPTSCSYRSVCGTDAACRLQLSVCPPRAKWRARRRACLRGAAPACARAARLSMETRHLVTLLQAEAPVSLAGVQRFVEALLEEHVTPSTVGEIVLRVHGFLCHAETHLQQAAPRTIAALAATSDDHQCVRDALEKLLVSKVYHRVFGVSEGARDEALHERLAGLSHLTCVGRLQPVIRCCCRPITNAIFPGRRASESVLRSARRPSKAGARRSSSSADWGSTVRLKTRQQTRSALCTLQTSCTMQTRLHARCACMGSARRFGPAYVAARTEEDPGRNRSHPLAGHAAGECESDDRAPPEQDRTAACAAAGSESSSWRRQSWPPAPGGT